MSRRRSLGWPITLGVVMIVLLVALTIGWVLLAMGYWTLLALGTTFLVLVLVGVVFYLTISVQQIRLNQRQSNFIDSVTHELKSPIASLKLYLQTLTRRTLTEAQQSDFFRVMLDDVDRLDALINHMLDAARADQEPIEAELQPVEVSALLRSCAASVCLRYRLPAESIQLNLEPAVVWSRPLDLDMLFRNLIDNALKYAGNPAWVAVESRVTARGVTTLISDNGPGIPAKLRRKIFGRFVRLGNELERSKTGTGLGLFIVRTLVKRLGGKISVRARVPSPGTVFELELPGERASDEETWGEHWTEGDEASATRPAGPSPTTTRN